GQGLLLHPRRYECRAHPGRLGLARRRALVHREGGGLLEPARDIRQAHRRQPGGAVRDRQGPHRHRRGAAHARQGRRALRRRAAARPTWPSTSAPRRRGKPATPASTATAATATPRNTTSSGSSANADSIRRRPSTTTSCSRTSASTCSGCREAISHHRGERNAAPPDGPPPPDRLLQRSLRVTPPKLALESVQSCEAAGGDSCPSATGPRTCPRGRSGASTPSSRAVP